MFKDIKSEMVKFPITTELSMSLDEVQMFMNERGVRHLPVLDENENLIGVVSERDVLSGKGKGLIVEDVMTSNPFIVDEDTSLYEVVETMAAYKYGSVLIIDAEQKLKGIFTTIDALRLLGRFLEAEPDESWAPENLVSLKDVMNFY